MSTNTPLRAGAGEADITPVMGIQLAGDIGRRRPVEEIRAPLYAKALVLEADGRKACLLSLDVTGVMRPQADRLRNEIAGLIGCAPEAVIVHALQSHSAPVVGNHAISDDFTRKPAGLPWLCGGDPDYIAPFFDGVLSAVKQANTALQPATLHLGRGMDGRMAHNRRFILRDGSVKTHPPLCDPNILCSEGTVDPEVGVALFADAAGKPLAVLLHHTCHPVHGYPMRWVHPDWPGAWSDGMRAVLGPGCVPLVVNGACGNIHHTNHLDPHSWEYDTIERMGTLLTETASSILPRLQPAAALPLAWANRVLPIPMRQLSEEEIATAEALLDASPEPPWTDAEKTDIAWDWVYALATLDLAEQQARQSWYDLEIQVLRVGDLALAAWPGEPFVEAQLEVKKASPLPYTFVAHFCNDSAGYIPTREALARGGYECRTANWSKLAPAALETIAAATTHLLQEVAGGVRV